LRLDIPNLQSTTNPASIDNREGEGLDSRFTDLWGAQTPTSRHKKSREFTCDLKFTDSDLRGHKKVSKTDDGRKLTDRDQAATMNDIKIETNAQDDEVRGYFDGIDGDRLFGWAYHPERTVELKVLIDGDLAGTCTADQQREDLEGLGLQPCAFSFHIPEGFKKGILAEIIICDTQGNFILQKTPAMIKLPAPTPKPTAIPVSTPNTTVPPEPEEEVGSEVKFLKAIDGEQKIRRVVVFPDYRATNPYQDLLYSRIDEEISIEYKNVDSLAELIDSGQACETVFHLHWPDPAMGGARNRLPLFRSRIEEFTTKIDRFKKAGGLFFFTVHNKHSHTVTYLDAEVDLHQRLLDLADRIFVHSSAAIDALAELYRIDIDKTRVIPHGNFRTAYPNTITQSEARMRIGLDKDDFVIGFIGQLRPYKGLETLIAAFQRLRSQQPCARLLIAGNSSWPTKKGYWTRRVQMMPGVHIVENFIPDDDLQLYCIAADFICLPYSDILTSGSAQLALTYSRPLIVPALPTLAYLYEADAAVCYNPRDPSGLYTALMTAESMPSDDYQKYVDAADNLCAEFDWTIISAKLGAIFNEFNLKLATDRVAVGKLEQTVTRFSFPEETVPAAYDRRSFIRVIIVVYQSVDTLDALIRSVPAQVANYDVEIMIVDNTADLEFSVRLKRKFRHVKMVATEHNLGYAGGNNIGIALALRDGAEYVFILNPDIVIEDGAIEALFKESRAKPDVGLLSPVVLNGHSTDQCAFGGTAQGADGQLSPLYNGTPTARLPKSTYESETLQGCSIWAGKSTLEKIGFMPEEYFLYFEETEWCLRANKSAGQCRIVPAARVQHFKSTQKGNLPAIHYIYYFLRAAILFAQRNGQSTDSVRKRYQAEFVQPWAERIAQRAEAFRPTFERLAERALEDGAKGVTGQVNLGKVLNEIADNSISFAGNVDKIELDTTASAITVTGWASYQDGNTGWVPARFFVVIDGHVVLSQACDGVRADVRNAGYAERSGFKASLPSDYIDGEPHQIDVRLISGHRLPAKLDHFCFSQAVSGETAPKSEIEPVIRARIDSAKDGFLLGWAVADTHPESALRVQAFLDGEMIGEADASIYREDIKNADIGTGAHAFKLPIPVAVWNQLERENFVLREAGQKAIIAERNVKRTQSVVSYDTDFDLTGFLRWSFSNAMTPVGAFEISETLKDAFTLSLEAHRSRIDHVPEGERPLVSVIMPSFNRRQVISTAIESVLNQSYRNFELIVVDDGSHDRTANFVEAEFGTQVKLISYPDNRGVSAARNVGLNQASGSLIAYLDTDNQWHKDYLAIMVGAFVDHPSADTAYSGQEIWQVLEPGKRAERRSIRCCPFNRAALEYANFIDLNVFMHRSEVFTRIGGFREDMRRLVDWELILRYTRDTAPIFVPCLLNQYFVGKVENQITAVEAYSDNIAKLRSASY